MHEEKSDRALRYIDLVRKNALEIVLPDLWKYEVSNVVLQNSKSEKTLSYEHTMDALFDGMFKTESLDDETFSWTYDKCKETGTTSYHMSFLALAKYYETKLITSDRKFYNKVHHLGDIELL